MGWMIIAFAIVLLALLHGRARSTRWQKLARRRDRAVRGSRTTAVIGDVLSPWYRRTAPSPVPRDYGSRPGTGRSRRPGNREHAIWVDVSSHHGSVGSHHGSVGGSPSTLVRMLWERSGAPEAIWRQRPDHAFRIGLISGLAELRADREAVEYYVGHVLTGMRAVYVDPRSLLLGEVARMIHAVAPRVRFVPELHAVSETTARKDNAK